MIHKGCQSISTKGVKYSIELGKSGWQPETLKIILSHVPFLFPMQNILFLSNANLFSMLFFTIQITFRVVFISALETLVKALVNVKIKDRRATTLRHLLSIKNRKLST